ncbi:MAG: AAA family ATPase, partial [Halanaerobiaceae bacterium]
MRPVTLNISGLNSFIQEEVIDFSSLMEKGLFGIFGPTGSGKSSILDAITIALYGEISRETTEFINTETGELYVRFEFTGGSNNNHYTVERKMKLKDDGGYRTSYARLISNKDNENQQIYDGVREIEEQINDIIGLNHEDFMRTVVLPQGKFSRFLKLTGRKRRDMLERILGLEQFGKKLMDKLKEKRDVRQDKLKEIKGVLNKYEEINSDLLQKKKNKLDTLNGKYEDITS